MYGNERLKVSIYLLHYAHVCQYYADYFYCIIAVIIVNTCEERLEILHIYYFVAT